MGKRKEIKFRRDGRVHEGRQNGVIFRLYEDRDKIKTCAPAYSVTAVDNRPLYNRYRHTKKKRIRKKYAKRILEWYRTEVAPC